MVQNELKLVQNVLNFKFFIIRVVNAHEFGFYRCVCRFMLPGTTFFAPHTMRKQNFYERMCF